MPRDAVAWWAESVPESLRLMTADDLARLPDKGRGYWWLTSDVVVEVASPSQHHPKLSEKARQWLSAGARLVYVVWPASKQVDAWHPGQSLPATLSIKDSLDGEDVIPGFSYPVASLFE